MIKYISTSLLLAVCVSAAGPGGTVPGYILDSRSSAIRAVYGIPGAMQLGAALSLPFSVASVVFGPAGDYALAIGGQQPAHAYLVQSLSGTPAVTDLGAVADGTRALTANATGSAALLYAGDGSAVQFVTGLPQSATVSGSISTAALAGAITAAALDSAGACAVLGTGALERLCSDGTSQRILPPGMNIADLVFTNKGEDVILADQTAQQIVLVSQYSQSARTSVLAGPADGIQKPVGLQAASATQIFAADAGSSALFVIDPTGAAPISLLNVNTVPTQLRSLTDRSILLLNDASAMPFTIMDLQRMQCFFIPTN